MCHCSQDPFCSMQNLSIETCWNFHICPKASTSGMKGQVWSSGSRGNLRDVINLEIGIVWTSQIVLDCEIEHHWTSILKIPNNYWLWNWEHLILDHRPFRLAFFQKRASCKICWSRSACCSSSSTICGVSSPIPLVIHPSSHRDFSDRSIDPCDRNQVIVMA